MKIVVLKQGSDAWQEWRAQHWMASEAPVVMGCAPSWAEMKTWADLRMSKAGLFEWSERAETNFKHGHDKEEEARRVLDGQLKMIGNPFCVEADDGKMAASLDWLAPKWARRGTRMWAEIKCPTPRAKWWQDIEDWTDIPKHYQWQMIHQAAVMGGGLCIFFVYVGPHNYRVIKRDWDELDPALLKGSIEHLRKRWEAWAAGGSGERADNEWTWWAEEYRIRKAKADAAKKEVDEARDKLIGLGEGEGCGVKVAKVTRSGGLDLKQMEADGHTDLTEAYRKPATESYTVRLTG